MRIPKIRTIERITKKVLELEKKKGFGLSITYVTDAQIRRLNKKYRGEDSYTDVLAFSMIEGRHIRGEVGYLGDIVISLDAAKRQAKYFDSTKDKELKLYLIHGILHLLGYDDQTKRHIGKMKKRERELFKKV